ncbi:MAG: hypothetical protein OCU12_00730 [Methanophagales archaeon]|nr:hypothetical protein [Methanophagales archaeon]
MQKERKIIKLHGMSSEKASRVKIRGHKKEYIYAALIGGKVVKGTKKEDVKDSNGKIHSLKGGGEIKGGEGRKGKWQICLHKISKFKKDTDFSGREIFIKILKSYPNNYFEYQDKKEIIKASIIPYMKELMKYLTDKTNNYNFLNKSFFDRNVDYFVIYHDDVFYVYEREEALKIFTELLLVDNNRTFQKVVLKYNNKIVGEIEIRTTNDGKYPSVLFNMLKLRAMDVLKKGVPEYKKRTPNIYAFGKAIKSFKL